MRTKKNGGYSLIELLVAVVILAIIVTPFLQSFLVSAKTNAKAKKVEQATIAGQNIMEELKAADIEAVIEEAAGKPGTTITEDPVTGGKVISFESEDVTVDNRIFQARVTLDSNATPPAPGAAATDPEASNEITDYNREALAQLYSMDSSQDGFYVQPLNLDTQMAGKFGIVTETMKDMYRDITLNIDKTGDTTTAEVEVKYTCNGVEKNTFPRKQCIYVSSDAETKLRNIYLFFYPMYNSTGGIPKETITIQNDDCIPVNVYLIKQTGMPGNEAHCKVNVRVLEKGRTEYVKNGVLTPLTALRTNLSETEDLLSVPAVYKQLEQLTYSTDGISYQPQKVVNSGGNSYIYSAEELLQLKGLSAEAAGDRVYRTTVEVYEKDDTGHEILVSLTGTKEK